MAAFMKTLHDLFKETDPNLPLSDSVQLSMPANIRFSMYETRETIEFVNRFASTILRVPLLSKLEFGPI